MLNKILLDDIEQKIVREYMCTVPDLLLNEQIFRKGDIYVTTERYPPTHHFDGEEDARE